MAISVAQDDTRRRLIATARGTLTLDELADFVRTQRSGDLQTYSLLFDARGADVTALRASEVEILAWRVGQIRKSEGPRAPVAVVADSDVLFGVMRMYQMMAENAGATDIHVVRSLEDAEAVLGW
jgi:hypothetical protein